MIFAPVVLSSTAVHQPIEIPGGEAVFIVEAPKKPMLIFPPISVIEGGTYEVKLILDSRGNPEQVILNPVKKNGKSARNE